MKSPSAATVAPTGLGPARNAATAAMSAGSADVPSGETGRHTRRRRRRHDAESEDGELLEMNFPREIQTGPPALAAVPGDQSV
ncbi:hypothetical protein [Catenuloplanes indicus]|uniref:Uncharacterized protein n=1 Tax=Catenuloplanes indicus TaxID=137267 RepID=A0AAE4AXC6_9ACTN|nr:hypothetical protein [Catenuloplanes indicus]MDQ0363948.1 hypothetical protein [Catenuloplanes indicus]